MSIDEDDGNVCPFSSSAGMIGAGCSTLCKTGLPRPLSLGAVVPKFAGGSAVDFLPARTVGGSLKTLAGHLFRTSKHCSPFKQATNCYLLKFSL